MQRYDLGTEIETASFRGHASSRGRKGKIGRGGDAVSDLQAKLVRTQHGVSPSGD